MFPKNTLLITTEPSTIKLYHKSYTEQFEWVLTSQPEWALRHSGRIYAQPCLRWFYGAELDLNFDDIKRHQSFNKTETISTVLSNKKQRHTLHHRRFHFINELRQKLTELIYSEEVFDQSMISQRRLTNINITLL